ncbi:MAG: FAD:protein FMN transferase [Saprospiraceae bacterium]|nr:FAD:protein FMN transferase [Saprospiraceae bacterium]
MQLRILFVLLVLFSACKEEPATNPVSIQFRGETMGTYYAVTYSDTDARNFQQALDSVLQVINLEVSTYIPQSTISQFNQSETGLDLKVNYMEEMLKSSAPKEAQPADWHFARNYYLSQTIRDLVGPAFDPTVMPLVNYWGFGYTPHKAVSLVDSLAVDSLLRFVGFDKVQLNGALVTKPFSGVQLDFSAVAKGYAVDELGRFLEVHGIKDYLVEIGGEVRARGKSSRGDFWKIGINTPQEGAATTDFELLVNLEDKSLATSGNYRNFYEIDGMKYAHTINPASGYPERSQLLSASVFAEDCAIADGLATAFMVLGLEASKEKLTTLKGIDACLIYGESDGSLGVFVTPGIKKYIESVD